MAGAGINRAACPRSRAGCVVSSRCSESSPSASRSDPSAAATPPAHTRAKPALLRRVSQSEINTLKSLAHFLSVASTAGDQANATSRASIKSSESTRSRWPVRQTNDLRFALRPPTCLSHHHYHRSPPLSQPHLTVARAREDCWPAILLPPPPPRRRRDTRPCGHFS